MSLKRLLCAPFLRYAFYIKGLGEAVLRSGISGHFSLILMHVLHERPPITWIQQKSFNCTQELP